MADLNLTVDVERELAQKLVSHEVAAQRVASGSQVWIPVNHYGELVLAGLFARADDLRDVVIRSTTLPDLGWFTPEGREHFDLQIQYAAEPANRRALEEKIADYHPLHMIQQHKAQDARPGEGRPIDVNLFQARPPDRNGWMCVGHAVWDSVSNVGRATHNIVQLNDQLPRTRGDSWVHVSQVDALVEHNTPVLFPTDLARDHPADPADRSIAEHVRTLIRDRDTLQIGLGSHSGALPALGAFDGLEDLSYFGELTVPGVIDLVRRGQINGKASTLHPGKVVVTSVGNSSEDLAFVEDNPAIEMRSYEYTNDPRVISSHENFVAINGALMIDLTGQIGVYTIGPRIYTGLGGQLAFVMGAAMSRTGRSITVLPSTAKGGEVSTVVARFEPGQVVSIPRELADTVVTEQGIARLWGKSLRERTREIIGIAHPDHRRELERAALAQFGP